jgi:PAS domain S-box-containing protein
MQPDATLQATYGILGLAYFTLGLAVGARALAQEPSPLRGRILALASFGLLHGVYGWLEFVRTAFDPSVPPLAIAAMCTLSMMPLAYFGLSRDGTKTTPLIAGFFAWAGLWSLAAATVPQPALIEPVTRYGVAIPAALIAAFAFLTDTSLRPAAFPVHRFAAAVFVAFAGLQLFVAPADYFPAALLNSTSFESVTGVSIQIARTVTALFATAAVLALLGNFDAAMRQRSNDLLAQSNATLADRDARLQRILEAEPECVKSVDAECRLLDMNPAGLKMIEATSIAAVRGKIVLDLVDEPFRQAFRDGVASVFRGEHISQRFAIVGLQGTRRWVEQIAAPLVDPSNPGIVREMIAVTRDITEQIEADQTLRDANARLEQAQRVAHMGYWDWNIVTNGLAWSDEIYRIFGLEP